MVGQQSFDSACIHHFSLVHSNQLTADKIRNVRFVFIAGCPHRARNLALFLQSNFAANAFNSKQCTQLEKLTKDKTRFDLYLAGPTLVANHGMGAASMSIALHELFLLCKQADILHSIKTVRFGTCGGVGVSPGTICITTKALDPLFRDYIDIPICGKLVRRPCVVDKQTASRLIDIATQLVEKNAIPACKAGATISTNDYYEEQGRTNGAICDHSEQEKFDFLNRASSQFGVINIEMEANYLVAMCHKLNVKNATVCVALNNRLIADNNTITPSQAEQYEKYLFALILKFTST